MGDGLTPSSALLLVVSAVAWMTARRLPLTRRGRWLVVPTLVCLSFPAGYSVVPWNAPLHLGGERRWLVLAVLGITFAGMVAHRRLGVALSAVAGLFLLGVLLWPIAAWEAPILISYFDSERPDPRGTLDRVVVLSALAVGILLTWAGLGAEPSRIVRRLASAALVGVVIASLASSVVSAVGQTEGHDWLRILVRVWNLLRFALIPYAEALLIVVGLFAWIVGARDEEDAASVFD